jgi:small-conductance mechanosensitive channel
MWAEERLRSLERRQAHERARLQARLEAADERVQQLQGVPARRGPSDRQQSQVEGKLDQVLRELAELRRDLRRPPAPKPPEPGKP